MSQQNNCAGNIDKLRAWLVASKKYSPSELLKDLEDAIHQEIFPSTNTVVDESLPQSTHREVNPSERCIIQMARKPSGLGRLVYQAVCEWAMSGLPFTYGFELLTHTDRVSAGEAFERLVRKRFLYGPDIHANFIADAAFSSKDVRTIVADNALPTAGQAVDMTLSINVSWDEALWSVLSKDLALNQYRTFYSPISEATVVLFKVEKKKKNI